MRTRKFYLFEIFLMIYYAWFFLPIMRGYFNSSFFKMAFFACFALGCALVVFEYILKNKRMNFAFTCLVPVLIYMLFMSFCYLFDIGDAFKHIRVSFTFWGSLIIFFLLSNFEESRVRLGKFLLLIFIITAITSAVGVFTDSDAARTLTYAANTEEDDYILQMKNIASIYFFQCLVIIVPIVLSLFSGKWSALGIVVTLFILFAVISASFSIALIMFFVSLGLFFVFKKFKGIGNVLKYFVIVIAVAFVLVIPWSDVLSLIARQIGNDKISLRLLEISKMLSGGGVSGDLALRFEVYEYSINTFLSNPFGVGVHYDYSIGANGIGGHSQFLDDLARYGLFALIFYVTFFVGYYKLLKREWAKIGRKDVVLPLCIVWFLFVSLNLAFRSADESMVMLFIVPILPSIVLSIKKRSKKQ